MMWLSDTSAEPHALDFSMPPRSVIGRPRETGFPMPPASTTQARTTIVVNLTPAQRVALAAIGPHPSILWCAGRLAHTGLG